jgi:outer membrane protein assembly factor BamD (BamD/ComL family)
MNKVSTNAISLVTGLITAAGANQTHPTLKLARSLVEEEQYIAAIYTAEKIIDHYPETTYSTAAQELIDIIRANYLERGTRCN